MKNEIFTLKNCHYLMFGCFCVEVESQEETIAVEENTYTHFSVDRLGYEEIQPGINLYCLNCKEIVLHTIVYCNYCKSSIGHEACIKNKCPCCNQVFYKSV